MRPGNAAPPGAHTADAKSPLTGRSRTRACRKPSPRRVAWWTPLACRSTLLASILAAVFAFRDEKDRPLYWIYNYKRGTFYPFVPSGGEQQRDNERELRLKAQIGQDLPVEPELERWFPLWGIPV